MATLQAARGAVPVTILCVKKVHSYMSRFLARYTAAAAAAVAAAEAEAADAPHGNTTPLQVE